MRLLQSLMETWSIDTGRIYTTGQSMGGMTSFYESIAYPDFFAASLFVGSQWDTARLSGLEEKPFFYIVSAGDPKASAGQSALLTVFDSDNAAYSHAEWGAQEDADSQNSQVENLPLEELLEEGQTAMSGAGEHMTSFDYAYKLEAVRDWLFAQHQ